MKVGILVRRLDYSGGTERQAVELALQLQRLGVEVIVYAAYYDPEKCFPDTIAKIEKIKYLRRSFPFGHDFLGRILAYLDTFRKTRALVKLLDTDIDLLNCHEYHVYPAAVKFRKRTNIPVVGMLNDPPNCGGVHEISQGLFKYVVTLIKRMLFGRFIQHLDRTVVLDNINLERLKKYYNVNNGVVIRSGLDPKTFDYNAQKEFPSETIKVIAVGSFCPWRRYEDLILSLHLLKKEDCKFHLDHVGTEVSNRRYAKRIKRMVEKLGLSSEVTFHGAVSEAEHVRLLAEADVLIFPNHPQTWGLVVFEALAVGVPVVATSTCGAAEVLRNGQEVLLVPPSSPEKISEMFMRLVNDQALWKKLRIQGRKFVENNISWNYYAENVLRLFEDTIRNGQRFNPAVSPTGLERCCE